MLRSILVSWGNPVLRLVKSPNFIFGCIGGLLFLGIFYFQYAQMDPGSYQYRDDGVITMSHAKNLVDYGHIGVDPSGKRLEGFSAPFQFWLYATLYKVTGMSWETFADLQTLLCTFLFGFIFLQFFERRWPVGVIFGIGAAYFLTWHHSFFQWHGSGMENAWTHVLFLQAVLTLFRAFYGHHIRLRWAAWLILASLARIDSIYHLAPILFTFALFWRSEKRSWKGFQLLGVTMIGWALYQGWRWYYFGSLLPNTGLAQGIDVRQNFAALWSGDVDHLRESIHWAKIILAEHGVWFLTPLLFWMPFSRVDFRSRFLLVVVGMLVITTFLAPSIFGLARLAPGRTTTLLVPFIALLLAWQISRVQLFKRNHLILIFFVPLGFLVYRKTAPVWIGPPGYICCSAGIYAEILDESARFEQSEGLHRLNVAAPDLGKLTYPKAINVTDLGYLGSPLMARFRTQEEALVAYFYQYALPDLIEVHGPWCEIHRYLLADPRFREFYTPIRESQDGVPEVILREWPTVREGIFVRKALTRQANQAEGNLIRDLKENLSLDRMQKELHKAVNPNDPSAHQYVVRTAYRFWPEFAATDQEEALEDLFAQTPSAAYDQAILGSGKDAGWDKDAYGFLRDQLAMFIKD